jgi:hypothetical protein
MNIEYDNGMICLPLQNSRHLSKITEGHVDSGRQHMKNEILNKTHKVLV